ncbi:hypothetical protein Lal_00001842 [Lupinus albus]|uniref:Uncharacterized protein n=1 Tax=Lupinus albus TaxID=3870 RepID=A0A6A4PQH3_LUPAL|nr:hypothetical protein Lalb_Chr11g0065241 [Lupinus albus]KAF1893374.1 hypothetical protein Lal_00001842 [Lupinus albus]
MDPLPRNIDDYIKQSIDHSLGLRVSSQTLEFKLRAYEDALLHLQKQNLHLFSKLKEKEELIERAKCEASMNAQALKKFVEENQRLALECKSLLAQCHHLEKECVLYDSDREALMEFGNNADERAREAQQRVIELERDLLLLEDELKKYKHHDELVDSPACVTEEESLLDSLLATITSEDDGSTYAVLKANSENESCKKLLTMWNCIKPLVAKVKSLEIDKEHLRTNLHKAEEEVKLLFDENNILDEENKRLMRLCKERKGSDGKHTSSASAKSNKRKTSPRRSSPLERKIDFEDEDLAP